MCGICGYTDLNKQQPARIETLEAMADTIIHRGPDSFGYYTNGHTGFGFRRLSIIDLEGGHQPIYNEDKSIVLICNGEIYNYQELRGLLTQKGHSFRTNSDVEVILHLYEDYGTELFNRLNGQFAFALYDEREQKLILGRDHFGINPLYYTVVNDTFIFGSEIKALLAHPLVRAEVDLTGLDQTLSFPGLVSPRTMFKGIESLKSGHYLTVKGRDVSVKEYWDLDYPKEGEAVYDRSEKYYAEQLEELITQSVKYRLQADVLVGFYLSGGLDSSLVAALIHKLHPGNKRHSFSITFADKDICESRYQSLVARQVGSIHHEIGFDWVEIADRLSRVIHHCECPLKETYNTASMALSQAAKENGITVVLTGEGADELFAGYLGYRFDRFRSAEQKEYSLETVLEDELRKKLWGDKDFYYEKDYFAFREVKEAIYAPDLASALSDFDCFNFELVDKEKIEGRHYTHQRSYVDFKLRIGDHLLADHGDRMALANSVEARYPFLDINLVEAVRFIPPELKINGFVEKYILRKVAENYVPQEVLNREKYAFVAPGSPYLLSQNVEWINDLLSYDRLKRQGYFNPDTIEYLKEQYTEDGFKINTSFESDLLIIALTFGVFLEAFNLAG
jgi:asparagine synthase (glutamine-hydrolysing)